MLNKFLPLLIAACALPVISHAEPVTLYPLAIKDGGAYYISSATNAEGTATRICKALGYRTMAGYDLAASDKVGAGQIAYANFMRTPSPGGFGQPVKLGPFSGWTLGAGQSQLNVLRDSGISLGGSSSIGFYRNETITLSVISVVACDGKTGERDAMGRAIQLQKP